MSNLEITLSIFCIIQSIAIFSLGIDNHKLIQMNQDLFKD